jgi:hypothetical protein
MAAQIELLKKKSPSKVIPQNQSVFEKIKEKRQVKPQEFAFESSDDLERDIERSSARTLSRMGERIAGLPGDIQSFVSSMFGLETKGSPHFPSSQELQEFSEKATRGYTKPQNEFEKKADEITGNIASMTIGPGSSTATSFFRTLGIPLAGALTKEGFLKGGASDKKAQLAETGTMIALDMASRRISEGGIKKYIGDFFKKAEQAIPPGAVVNVKTLHPEINALRSSLERGGANPKKTNALSKLKEIQDRISNGTMPANEIAPTREAINAIIENEGGFDYLTNRKIREASIHHLNAVKDKVIKIGSEYGKSNPEFLDNWTKANRAAAVSQQSNKISNFLEKIIGSKLSKTVGPVFGISTGAAHSLTPGGIALTGGLGGMLAVGYQSIKILQRITQSPELRAYYTNVVKAATKGNAAQAISNLNKLDQGLKKKDKEQKEYIKKLIED